MNDVRLNDNYQPVVEILLATFNGEKYIEEFLESLEKQTFKSWSLIVRDDGSSDSTHTLLTNWLARTGKGYLVTDDLGNIGTIANFSRLTNFTRSKYIMFADQDDVWRHNKIELLLNSIKLLENKGNKFVSPALVFSDLTVTNERLQTLAKSYLSHQGLVSLVPVNYKDILTQNIAPGCSMMFNSALLRMASPIPNNIPMHDWWFVLLSSLFGYIEFISEPTVYYRQHGMNQVGAPGGSTFYRILRVLRNIKQYRQNLLFAQSQASLIIERYRELLNSEQLTILSIFSNLSTRPPLIRQYFAFKAGIKKNSFSRSVALYLLM